MIRKTVVRKIIKLPFSQSMSFTMNSVSTFQCVLLAECASSLALTDFIDVIRVFPWHRLLLAFFLFFNHKGIVITELLQVPCLRHLFKYYRKSKRFKK